MHRRDAAVGMTDLDYMSDDDVAGDSMTAPGECGGRMHGSVIAVSASDVAALARFSEGCLMCALGHRHCVHCVLSRPSTPSAMFELRQRLAAERCEWDRALRVTWSNISTRQCLEILTHAHHATQVDWRSSYFGGRAAGVRR